MIVSMIVLRNLAMITVSQTVPIAPAYTLVIGASFFLFRAILNPLSPR